MDNDYLKIGGRGFGKTYMSGLDGRKIELGRPQELKFEIVDNDMFTEVSDITINKIAEEIVRSNENRLIQRIYELPENYIINDGATILFWKDGTKTIVKRSKDEKFDKRLGFLTAYFQKHCGMSKTKANKFLDNLEVSASGRAIISSKIQTK